MKQLITNRMFGGMLLVAGSCIGAGMLALPILTGLCGFFPSLALFIIAWAFMTYTSLLLVEANGWFQGQINIVSMAGKGLGLFGKMAAWVLYLFLFYSLLVAYIAGSRTIFGGLFPSVSDTIITIVSTFFFAVVVFFGTKPVDLFNRLLMAGLILAYLGMVFSGIDAVQTSHLLHVDPSYMIFPLPVLLVSFGFQNMIPSLTAYLHGDLKKMRMTIFGGSLMALAIYLVWELIVIGILPLEGPYGILDVYQKGEEVTKAMSYRLGSSLIVFFAQMFAFFAIVTSLLAQALTLMHFIADGLNIKPNKKNSGGLIFVVFLPPLFFALIYPTIFYKALSFAGGICAVLLFGVLPSLMVWMSRYRKKMTSSYRVKGGKTALICVMAFSLFIVVQEILKIFGVLIG